MKKGKRYDVLKLEEAQFEPGSRHQVLKNRLGIKTKRKMDLVEALAYERALAILERRYDKDHRFTAHDICNIHKIWLEEIYGWAGKYRQVKLTKDNFTFAFPSEIPKLMKEFEKHSLERNTPCNFASRARVIKALAEAHTELILLHPFREGNGRTARILTTLMALQADMPRLNFSSITGIKKGEYIAAIHAGMDENYRLMERVFDLILRESGVVE